MLLLHFMRRSFRRPPPSFRSAVHFGVVALCATLIFGCDDKAGDPAALPLTVAEAPPGGGKGKKNKQPIADPGGPYTTTDGTVQLDGTGSRDPDGPDSKLTHLWSFHDGSSATGATPTKEYEELGEYTVSLIVTDRLGLDSDPVPTTVTFTDAPNEKPVADAGGPYETTDGTVTFDGSGSDDPDGENANLTYAWSFGDEGTGTGPTPSHVYAETGSYTVTLVVTDELGLESDPTTTTATYTDVPNQKPVANAGGPYQTTDGTVTFDGSGSDDPDGANENLTYAWSFGDEGTGTGPSPTHVYAETGSYTVTLVVTDELGLDSDPATTTATYTDDGGGNGAVRTTSQSGLWSDPATWGGEPPPVDGDQAVVRHAVTVGTSVTTGLHSPAGGTLDLDVQPGGTVLVATGQTLRIKGNVEYSGWIQVEAGAALLQDAPAGEVYTVNVRSGAPLDAVIRVRGSQGNPGTVDLNAGSGVGVLAPVQLAGNGVLDFEHGVFRGGDVDNLNRVRIRSGQHYRLIDSRVENSAGIFQLTPVAAGGQVTIQNTTWVGTVTSESLRLNRWDDPSVHGTTNFVHSVFDKKAFIEGPDAVIDGCYMAEGLVTTAGLTVYPRVVQNSLVRRTVQGFMNITGDYRDNIHVEDYTSSNPHGVQVNLNAVASTLQGNIFKYTGSSGAGDMIGPRSTNPAPVSMMVLENLVLPNGNGSRPSGTLVSLLGDNQWTVRIERNTYPVLGSSGGIAIAETYQGHPGYVPTINSNLAVGMVANSGSVVHEVHSGIVADYVTEADYNGYHDIDVPYDAPASAFANTPGGNDVAADPMFVDSSRDLTTYDLLQGGDGTVAHLLSEVARMNDPGFNPAYEPVTIRAWIREGFRPLNPAFQGTGKGGSDIGAVPF